MITSAEIAHYKSIADARLKFNSINIIVGPNGSGKSNIIDAMYFLHDCVVEDIDTAVTKRHGIDSIRQWSRTRPYNITIEVSIKNERGRGRYKLVLSSSKGNYNIIEETGEWTGRHPRDTFKNAPEVPVDTTYFVRRKSGQVFFFSGFEDEAFNRPARVSSGELFVSTLSSRIPIAPYTFLRPIADEIASFSSYSIYPNTLRRPQVMSRDTELVADGSNLATILKKINTTARFKKNKDNLIAALRYVMPIASDILVKSAGGYYVPVVRVQEHSGDMHDFNLSQISDGTLRVLGLLAAFYQPFAPSKIAIEEPEQMIHPGALPVIADAANEFCSGEKSRGSQVFITTHSPSMLDMFQPENIIWAKFKHGITDCSAISKRQLELIERQLFSAGEIMLSEGFFE